MQKGKNMQKSQDIIHSSEDRRLILIAEDEFINRELLKGMLTDE